MLDHLLDPDSPTKAEMWVEDRVEELVEELGERLAEVDLPDWFDDCIDWDKVSAKFSKEAEQEWEEREAERQISAWEERQEVMKRGWLYLT